MFSAQSIFNARVEEIVKKEIGNDIIDGATKSIDKITDDIGFGTWQAGVSLATIKKETNSYKWMIFSAVYTFIVAYIIAVTIFQVGTLLGFS